MAIRFGNGFGVGASNNGGGGGPVVNCSPSSTFGSVLSYESGTPLTWSDDITGYSLYTGGFTSNDDGYSNNAIATLPSNFFMACTGSTKVYMSTNGFITIGVGSNNWSNSPQGANIPYIGGNVGDLLIDTGSSLNDGTTQGAYYKITNSGDFMKFELKVFEVMFQQQNLPASYQINLYKDSTYQWIETLIKDTTNHNYNAYSATIGPTSSTDVSQVPSTTSSQIWRGDLAGQTWEYMGEGSVVNISVTPTPTPTPSATPQPLSQFTPNGTPGSNGLLTYLNYTNGVDSGNNILLPDSSGFNHPYVWTGINPYNVGTTGYTFDGSGGSGSYAYASDASNYNLGFNQMSFEMWVKIPSIPGSMSLIAAGGNNSGGWALRIDGAGSQLNLVKYNIADQTINLTSQLQNDTWYHIAALQGGTSLTFMINGVIVGAINTATTNNFSFPSGTVNIAKDYYTGTNYAMTLGYLKVYDYCLNASDVTTEFNNTKADYGFVEATPTPTPTMTSSITPTPTPSATMDSTPTPTPSSTATPTGFITISEVGSNVVMTASGTIDLTGLTLVTSNAGPYGGGGLGGGSATFLMGTTNVYFNEYSGFTSVPSNFGTSGGGLGATSSSGDVFGVITQGAPPYLLVVPTGFTSGGQISSTQTFTGQTFSSLGLVAGTYTYTWGSGQSLSVVVGGVVPTPTPTPSTGSNVSAWYFYSDEGTLNVGPPNSPGNAIFTTAGGGTETFNPNRSSGTSQLYFSRYDSNGTDYGTQFNNLMTSGGSISITQNGQTATYATATPYQFQYNSASNGFLIIPPAVSQTATTASTFVYGDPIRLTFGS